jgi:hypothetical protein
MSTDLVADLRRHLHREQVEAELAAAASPGDWLAEVGPAAGFIEQHIAAHQPTRVLADIAAKRKLIARGGPFCTSRCDEPGREPMDPETNWTTPLEHHLDCGAYEAAKILAEAYGIRAEGPTAVAVEPADDHDWYNPTGYGLRCRRCQLSHKLWSGGPCPGA